MPAGPFHVAIYQSPGGRLAREHVFDELIPAWNYGDRLRAIVAMNPYSDTVGVIDLDSGEFITHDDYLDLACEPGEQQGAAAHDSP